MSLSSDMRRARKNIQRDSERKYRGTCLDLSRLIIKRTPVGNPSEWASVKAGRKPPAGYIGGTLRNSWYATTNSPSSGAGREPDASGSGSEADLNRGAAQLQVGDAFYLTNNMPYATRIEDGYSGQAPAGMVGVTIAEAKGKAEAKFRG